MMERVLADEGRDGERMVEGSVRLGLPCFAYSVYPDARLVFLRVALLLSVALEAFMSLGVILYPW